MVNRIPRQLLNCREVGLIIVSESDGSARVHIAPLQEFGLPTHTFQPTQAPAWKDDALWSLLETPQWRQLLILSESLDAYTSGLVFMALQKGFDVYLAVPDLDQTFSPRLQRLQQASAVILSIEDAVSELRATREP